MNRHFELSGNKKHLKSQLQSLIQERKLAIYLSFFVIILAASLRTCYPNEKSLRSDAAISVQGSQSFYGLHVLIFFKSDSDLGQYTAHRFEEMLNQSVPVDLWDIKSKPFPADPVVLRNFSLIILDGGVSSYDLNSDHKETIWSALNDGISFLFNYHNTKVYYDKFGVTCELNETNYIWLDHNHAVLAPNFLYSAGTGWHSHKPLASLDNSFYMNTSALPTIHDMLLDCNNSKGERPFPVVICGNYGKGKFAVITGKMAELDSFDNYGMPWIVSRVIYWLLPDEQPLRQYCPYLSIAFRDDDLGGTWAGSVENQVGNMSMVLSWGVPITWAFACEDWCKETWSDPRFVAKIKELEEAGHEIFLHGSGYAPNWTGYDYSTVRARIEQLKENYEEVLGHPPRGWVTPQHGYTDTIIRVLEEMGFKYDSENRGEIGTMLLNDKVIDVSARPPPPLDLDAYKDYVDYEWLFGGRVLCFYTHFYTGALKEMDQWINNFKEFVSNYPHRWITLDELADIVHRQPQATIVQIMSDGNTVTIKASSSAETALYLELKNSAISNAIVNGVSVHFRSENAIMTRVNGALEISVGIGAPQEDFRVTYSDNPPVEISFVKQEFAVSLLASQGRNVTVQIKIPYNDGWNVNCTEPSWSKEWNSSTQILTVWVVSSGYSTISVFGVVDNIPPVANAGSDHTADEGAVVIFDGSGSYDNMGIVSYDWDFGDGSAGTGINTTHPYKKPGTYIVTLTVKDDTGNSAIDTATVNVLSSGGAPGFPYESIIYGLAGLAGLAMGVFLLRKLAPKRSHSSPKQ